MSGSMRLILLHASIVCNGTTLLFFFTCFLQFGPQDGVCSVSSILILLLFSISKIVNSNGIYDLSKLNDVTV